MVDVLGEENKNTNVEDIDDEDIGGEATGGGVWLTCVSASDQTAENGLIARMKQHAHRDQQTSRETITLSHKSYYFDVQPTPIVGSDHDDSKLVKISLRHWGSKAKQGSTRHVRFHTSSGQGSAH